MTKYHIEHGAQTLSESVWRRRLSSELMTRPMEDQKKGKAKAKMAVKTPEEAVVVRWPLLRICCCSQAQESSAQPRADVVTFCKMFQNLDSGYSGTT